MSLGTTMGTPLPISLPARLLGVALALGTCPAMAAVQGAQAVLSQQACDGLRRAVQADQRGDGSSPLLLASYRTGGEAVAAPPMDRALDGVAFTYDNALAGIALLACGQTASARRIADALVLASTSDAYYRDGRVRNAYKAGPMTEAKPALPGYWSAERKQWIADAYQVSSATGNVAWAALLLLNMQQASPDARYLAAATRLLAWVEAQARATVDPDGYQGGWYGWDGAQHAQTWKSTEHNIDIAMAAAWTARLGGSDEQARQGRTALAFVSRMWSADERRFYIGTEADGASIATRGSGLDAQLWPILAMPPGQCAWRAGLAWVERHHRFGEGYGFKDAPDGIWTEGSAQMAATLLAVKGSVPESLWRLLAAQRTDNGLYLATPSQRISTGLAIGPDSKGSDFYYYRWPHLGATAWIALAAAGWNPFTGKANATGATPCPS